MDVKINNLKNMNLKNDEIFNNTKQLDESINESYDESSGEDESEDD